MGYWTIQLGRLNFTLLLLEFFHSLPCALPYWPIVFSHTHSSVLFSPTTAHKYPVLFRSNLGSTIPLQSASTVSFPNSDNHNIHYTIHHTSYSEEHTHNRTSFHFLSFYTLVLIFLVFKVVLGFRPLFLNCLSFYLLFLAEHQSLPEFKWNDEEPL